jgi:hypothetical protein
MAADPLRRPHEWLDLDAGPVFRPYALTRGRVAPSATDYDLVAFVIATSPETPPGFHPQPEHRAIVAAAGEPITIVELASKLDLSIGVLRVLLSDLRSAGMISLDEPPAASEPHDVDVLKAVVHGLRTL